MSRLNDYSDAAIATTATIAGVKSYDAYRAYFSKQSSSKMGKFKPEELALYGAAKDTKNRLIKEQGSKSMSQIRSNRLSPNIRS